MKTIEQAAKESSEKAGYNPKIASDIVGKTVYECAFKAGVIFAQRFIPFTEEQPNHHQKILVKDSISESISYGQFSQDLEWFHCHKSTNVLRKSDIVSWRPISFL